MALTSQNSARPESPVRSVGELGQSEILIIEDETLMTALMQRYLKTLDLSDLSGRSRSSGPVRISTLETGFELIKADLSSVRVAIVDILLPQITGVDLIRDFRRRYPSMGIVPVSGMATEPMKRGLKTLLPESFELLSKPLRRDPFIEAFLKAWEFSQAPLRSSNTGTTVSADEESSWTVGVTSSSHPVVSVVKRKKPSLKAA